MAAVHILGNIEAIDLQGEKTKQALYLKPPTPASALADGLTLLKALVILDVAASDAGFKSALVSELRGFSGVDGDPATQPYNSCTDHAVLEVLTEAGGRVHPEIPAPVKAMFLSDDFTVDTGTLGVLIGLLTTGGVCDSAGNLYTAVIAGYRSSIGARAKKAGGI